MATQFSHGCSFDREPVVANMDTIITNDAEIEKLSNEINIGQPRHLPPNPVFKDIERRLLCTIFHSVERRVHTKLHNYLDSRRKPKPVKRIRQGGFRKNYSTVKIRLNTHI